MTVTGHMNRGQVTGTTTTSQATPPSLPQFVNSTLQGSTEADRFIESRLGPDPMPAFRVLPPVMRRYRIARLSPSLSELEVARIADVLGGGS